MIHCFNPGHEAAVLNASKHYQPAANQRKMQEDLAFLPAWYAEADDWVWVENALPDAFRESLRDLRPCIQTISIDRLANQREELYGQSIDLWGIAPQSVHRFEAICQQYDLAWNIPQWKDELRGLGSRRTALQVLTQLIKSIPELQETTVPHFVSDLGELEEYVSRRPGRWLVKSPFSSSGRGLVWLPSGPPARSERQIISGMLKKQAQVSIEPALDKIMDFSMHFQISAERPIRFLGYSVFQTNAKGAYTHSLLASQKTLESHIYSLIDKDLLSQIKARLSPTLQQIYAPHYRGNLGVDMLIYRTPDDLPRLHPCIEINMRKSMGYLALCLHSNHLHTATRASFHVDYHPSPALLRQHHIDLKQSHPLVIENNRIISGYLNLCPVTDTSVYLAYLVGGEG
jgi:hypothetical protein